MYICIYIYTHIYVYILNYFLLFDSCNCQYNQQVFINILSIRSFQFFYIVFLTLYKKSLITHFVYFGFLRARAPGGKNGPWLQGGPFGSI